MALRGQLLERPTLIAAGPRTLEGLWHRGTLARRRARGGRGADAGLNRGLPQLGRGVVDFLTAVRR